MPWTARLDEGTPLRNQPCSIAAVAPEPSFAVAAAPQSSCRSGRRPRGRRWPRSARRSRRRRRWAGRPTTRIAARRPPGT
eukprot:842384-Prymnesium_polylepis.1